MEESTSKLVPSGLTKSISFRMNTKIFLMIAALAIISFASCSRNSTIDQAGINIADDEAVTDAVFEDVFNTVDNADIILEGIQKGDGSKSIATSDTCPVVIIDHPADAVWPKTIIVDFGTGCTCPFENVRSGKIIIVVTGRRLQPGSKKTVTFDNYYFNSIKVEGTKEVENLGYNENQNMEFSVKLTGGKLTLPGDKVIERSFEHKREWLAGLNTRYIWDDECLITGTASGVNINGVVHNNTITTALHWKRVCKFIVSGVVEIEREGLDPVVLNYGTGECDAIATVTIGDESKEIMLRNRLRLMP